MPIKVYKYNVKIVKIGLEGSFKLKHVIKHLFSILCAHLNLNQKNMNLAGYHLNRPVTGQTGPVNRSNRQASRYEPVEHEFLVWILNLTGFFCNRSIRCGLRY